MNDHTLLDLPEHVNPSPDHTASAPYNFVPLPEVVVTAVHDAEKDLPNHDTYAHTDYPHTGYFDVILTTRSPLYVRCPFTLEQFLRQEREEDKDAHFRQQVKNTPDFFYTRDPHAPVIPGSSLRGMLRSALEIVSYGKMQWVTDKKLFFRTVDPTAVGDHYRSRMVGKVEAGFLRSGKNGYSITTCQMLRVARTKLDRDLYDGQGPNQTPRWHGLSHQWAPVWVQVAAHGPVVEQIAYQPTPGHREGRLVLTGNVPRKLKEFVFLMPTDNAEDIPVPEVMLERFQDDDQMTQWQERAFPRSEPQRNSRQRDGLLRHDPGMPGDPVFFLRERGQLLFFGRAQMFRLPYTQSPLDLVPQELRRPEEIDYAEAIFGYTKGDTAPETQGHKARAYAGRVFVTDAHCLAGQTDIWFPQDPVLVPRILATPKPTAFQQYLTQQEPNDKDHLHHYDSPSPGTTVIRGHKRYWHQRLSTQEGMTFAQIRSMIEEEKQRLQEMAQQEKRGRPDTQHTQFRPVKPGVQFQFRLYFENLSAVELGAICWVLHPPGEAGKEYCHQLGMGKPLGMGAAHLAATLYFTNRQRRYHSLFHGDQWQTGITEPGTPLSDRDQLTKLTLPFETRILEILKPTTPCTRLSEMKRIALSLKMLEWPGFAPLFQDNRFVEKEGRPNTRYMSVQAKSSPPNEYSDRPVLPDPAAFGDIAGKAVPQRPQHKRQGSGSSPAATPGPRVSRPLGAVAPGLSGATANPVRTAKPAGRKPNLEWVTLIEDVKAGKARVETSDGAPVPCTGIPRSYPPATQGTRCRAEVTRQDGRPLRATFKQWQ